MTGSGDELAAGARDRNRLRASDAGRGQVVEVLKAAFVQGRLTKDEFALRVTQVHASRTYADPARSPSRISPESPHTADARRNHRPRTRLPGLLAGPRLRPRPRATPA